VSQATEQLRRPACAAARLRRDVSGVLRPDGRGAIITRTVAEPNTAELLVRLVTTDLRFVVIGGIAARSWGAPGRRKDLDVVLDPNPPHLTRVAELIVRLNGHAVHGGMRARSAASISSALLSCCRVLLNTDLGSLDVVNRVEGVPSYEVLVREAQPFDVSGVHVPVCSLAHLRLMKSVANRPCDRADLKHLEAVLR
jgi:hypothetical protein